MLMRTDPFRELDRLTQQLMGPDTWSRPSAYPWTPTARAQGTWRPSTSPVSDALDIDIDVERNMLTVRAERRPATQADDVKMELSERPLGVFSRQIVLDTEHIHADYDAGVLTLRIPSASRPRCGRRSAPRPSLCRGRCSRPR